MTTAHHFALVAIAWAVATAAMVGSTAFVALLLRAYLGCTA